MSRNLQVAIGAIVVMIVIGFVLGWNTLAFLAALIGPLLVGYFAPQIFGTTLYGTLADIVIALVGGSLVYFPYAHWANAAMFRFTATDTPERLIHAAMTTAAALVLLFIFRMIGGKRAAPAMAGYAPAAPIAPLATSSAASAASSASGAGSSAVMEQIRKLSELHAAGVLTDAEFDAKKAELLKRI